MKVLVCGLGSMGRRRIRLLSKLYSEIDVIGVDIQESRRNLARSEYGIRTYESIDDAFFEENGFDIAFVSTSPLSHNKIISACLDKGMNVFSEINVVSDGYFDNVQKAKSKGLILFLSSTFMYRKEIEYIKERIKGISRPKSYIYHVGQYLPDWHPWENYEDFFVIDKRTNGCREIMTIEFPWLFDVFGIPNKWLVQKRKISNLKVDYSDIYQILMSHDDGTMGVIQVDVVSRKPVRKFECISEELYIAWNGTPDGLYSYDYNTKNNNRVKLYDEVEKLDEYSESIIEDAYLSEIKEFFAVIQEQVTPRYTFETDLLTLSVVDSIEEEWE